MNAKFIITKDKATADRLIKEGLILLSSLYDCWVFVNDNKDRDDKNVILSNKISV